MNVVYILLLGLLMQAVRSFAPHQGLGAAPGGTVLGAGFLLLTAYLVGTVFKRLGLPKLTGYLATGVVTGPAILDLVSERMLSDLSIFNGVATALIALSAGTELDFRELRPLLPTIRWMSATGITLTIGGLAMTVFFMRDSMPFMQGLDANQQLAIAIVLGITLAAQSPAVVVALRKELEAEGPLVRTVLGLVVMAELAIVLLYTLASAIAQTMLGGQASWMAVVGRIAWEIPGSLLVGILIGVVISPFMKLITSEGALFIATIGFLIAEVGRRIDFDILLVALAAGLYIRNFTPYGHRLHDDVEAASLPIFVTFFSVAGATLHLSALQALLAPVLIFTGVRAAISLSGAWLGATVAKAPSVVRKYAGFGTLPQAGLALSIAILFSSQFPQLGDSAAVLIFGVVTVNELVCPVIYRIALVRSGEAYKTGESEQLPLSESTAETGA